MPTRPKGLIPKVAVLEEWSFVTSAEAFGLAPERCKVQGLLAELWGRVIDSTMQASIDLERLGDHLRERAGIQEESFASFICSDDDDEMGTNGESVEPVQQGG